MYNVYIYISYVQTGKTSPIRRSAPPGIMGNKLRAPLKPLGHSQHCSLEGSKGSPQLGPHDTERLAPLSIW